MLPQLFLMLSISNVWKWQLLNVIKYMLFTMAKLLKYTKSYIIFQSEVVDFCIFQSLILKQKMSMKFYLFMMHPKAWHIQLLEGEKQQTQE